MKIFIPLSQVVKGDVVEHLHDEGFSQLVREEKRESFKTTVTKLVDCDALFVWPEKAVECGIIRDIAAMAGIEIVYGDSHDEVQELCEKIAEFHEIPLKDISGKTRHGEAVNARLMLCYILYEKHYSRRRIGVIINRDRSTTYYYVRRSLELFQHESNFRSEYYKVVGTK